MDLQFSISEIGIVVDIYTKFFGKVFQAAQLPEKYKKHLNNLNTIIHIN